MITATENTFENFGRCLFVSNGILEAVVTLDFGPRVIRFGFVGGQNLFVTQPDRRSQWKGDAYDARYGKGSVTYLYGGHRIWVAPESAPETYYPDNDPVAWESVDGGYRFTPPAQRANDVQLGLFLRMDENQPCMTVENTVTNVSDADKEYAVWTVSAMNLGGLEIVPQADDKTGLLPNRTLSLWPYTNVADARFYHQPRYLAFRQDPNATGSFKIGSNNRAGKVAYVLNGDVFRKESAPQDPSRLYPDGNVSFETYLCPYICELETIGPLERVKPGQTVTLHEVWSLTKAETEPDPSDDEALDAFWHKIW